MEQGFPARRIAMEKITERLLQEFDESDPENIPYFIVDFMCKNYGEHLLGFSRIWNAEYEFEQERFAVIDFFRSQFINSKITGDFIGAGFDTLEALCTITPKDVDEIEKFSNKTWLPGHKIRLQQIFSDISTRVQQWRDEREQMLQKPCQHLGSNKLVVSLEKWRTKQIEDH
ncbi:uncharacterized protein ELE39_001057 [Cryptosporidium sp. chipmunk genotype I]|uniref:uncharacterized protein n=1 Tax=Cryptosporidium sp. chipmunk genotype I TaxID=1280935 RepID=UPI00351A91D5|nr:hypothetical protein ELE39_001057 [Cryptosporidium sp. chipmunk genotype I]